MFKKIAGTKDILPEEVGLWQQIEGVSRRIFSLYNFKEIRTPIIEEKNLFFRSLGDTTEIVQKQMFEICHGEDHYCLRPEATASVVRAYLENNLDKQIGFIKLFYIGPMFRAERPQKGRLRQFHHIGVEAIGSLEPEIDIEIICLANSLLKAYGIDGFRLEINSLGCFEDKKKFVEVLREKLKPSLSELCSECQIRYQRNILRILDCKQDSCKQLLKDIPAGTDFLCSFCKTHFQTVISGLKAQQIPYFLSKFLVRGLDYYNRTVFEFKHPDLGPQQDALGAGGRYDSLVKQLGGEETGAVGFALGIERLLLVLNKKNWIPQKIPLVYLICLGENARKHGINLLAKLRENGITADTDFEHRSLKGALRKANDFSARYVLILGDDELKTNTITLKDMRDGNQQKVLLSEIVQVIKRLFDSENNNKTKD
ncbi:MAG: histidine--tRNA ligase [Candidatus Omnitrophica bacterium]|nr:histidine--tRNA ligase [Candidatus Omnitrophota bacterium]